MSRYSKVSWQEGMFLLPQHFQQADRHHEAALSMRLRGHGSHGWGVLGLQINEDALQKGTLEVLRCQAILPDGAVVDVPDVDTAPPPLQFTLDPQKRTLKIYLTVPRPRAGLPVVTPNRDRADIRYLDTRQEVPDDHDPEQKQEIEIAEKNLRLAVGTEAPDGVEWLQITEIQRSADGTLLPRPDYVPPCPAIHAAPALMRTARELLGLIAARANSIGEERSLQDYVLKATPEDMLPFLFLLQLNQHAPVLRQMYESPGTHPFHLYTELCRLCGALSTFDLKGNTALDLPPYDHFQLMTCFGMVDKRLRSLLSRLFNKQYEIFPLLREELFWKGLISDPPILLRGQLYLSVVGLPVSQINNFPNACKIAEYARIDTVMRTFVSEVTLTPVPTPPQEVPTRPGTCYFQIHRDSRGFENIIRTGQLAVFIASAMPVEKLELIGLRPREDA